MVLVVTTIFPEKTIPLRDSVKSKQFNVVSSTLESEILLQDIGVSSVDVQFVQCATGKRAGFIFLLLVSL